jgi:hypothetical protein
MTAFFTDFAERNARTGRPSSTPLEIQRWEDDGGAVLPRLTEGGSSFGCIMEALLWRRAVAGPVWTTDVRIRELVAAD